MRPMSFATLGGAPTAKIRYDNLPAAVAQVLGFSRTAVETARWTAFRSHFAVDPFSCQPDFPGAHEKPVSRGRSAGSAATTWSPSLL
jgi:hypothetical protein